MKQIDANYPSLNFQKALIPEQYDANKLFDSISNLVTQIKRMQQVVAIALTFNAAKEHSGTTAPTPEQGEMYIWEDTGATTGQPTHYIVYNFGGTVVTFASVEVAP